MSTTDPARHAALDGLATLVTHIGIADRNLVEITGGTPPYARRSNTWNASASGQKTQASGLTFDIPAGVEACFALYRGALSGGTDYGYAPLGGFAPVAASFDATTDVFRKWAHGYTVGQQVVLADVQGAGLATGFTEGTIYYVISPTTDTFQLSATSGGAAITSTANMECIVQRVLPATDAAQWQLSIPAGTLTLDGRFA